MDDTPLFSRPERLTGDDAPCAHLCYCERAANRAEIARLQEAKRMAGLIADERSRENVALRAALKPFADAITAAEKEEPCDPEARLLDCFHRLTLYEFGKARDALEQGGT